MQRNRILVKGLQAALSDGDLDGAWALLKEDLSILKGIRGLSINDKELRERCLLAETLDYVGREEALSVVMLDGETIAKKRPTKISKQQAWCLLHFGMAQYRAAEYDKAINLFDIALSALELLHSDAPCHGSLARANYLRGLALRQKHDFPGALSFFAKSVYHAHQATASRPPEECRSYWLSMARSVALGSGWIAYATANLSEAKIYFSCARVLMTFCNAKCLSEYINVWDAAVTLSAEDTTAGANGPVLEAVNELRNAHAYLIGENSVYGLRAAVELARGYIKLGELDSAADTAKTVLSHKDVDRDPRSKCNAHILLSRIHRGNGKAKGDPTQYELAFAEALLAQEVADDDLSKIDGLIAEGEALREQGKLKASIRNFEAALKLGKDDPKVRAVCRLHLAKVYLADRQRDKAASCYNAWMVGQTGHENAFISGMAKELADRLRRSSFVIEDGTENLDVKYWQRRVGEWLVAQLDGKHLDQPGTLDALNINAEQLREIRGDDVHTRKKRSKKKTDDAI